MVEIVYKGSFLVIVVVIVDGVNLFDVCEE